MLAFFVDVEKKRWILWTPNGYYDAAPGAEDLIGWHVNRGPDKAADFFPLSRFRIRCAMRLGSDQSSMKPGLACWLKSPPDWPKPASSLTMVPAKLI